MASLDEEIKELQQLKKNLKQAKDIALTTGAKVFAEYGIDKLEGLGISSITLTKEQSKTTSSFEILNEEELIKRGYFRVIIDEAAIKEALVAKSDELLGLVAVKNETITVPAKLKINKRRKSGNNSSFELMEEKIS